MNTDFTLEFRRNHIHVQYSPGYEVTLQGTTDLWKAISDFCHTHNCNCILIEGTVDAWKMNTADVYEMGIEASNIIYKAKIALCFVNCTENDLTEFFQLVAGNRGTQIKSFSDRHEAMQWLGVEEPAVISKPISIDH
ncbi:MAG: hypothetical protein ABJA66_18365 [Actinomycetota bacterium]